MNQRGSILVYVLLLGVVLLIILTGLFLKNSFYWCTYDGPGNLGHCYIGFKPIYLRFKVQDLPPYMPSIEGGALSPEPANQNANWQTYTDLNAGFSFKYPPSMVFSSDQTQNTNALYKITVSSQTVDSIVSTYQPLGATTQQQMQDGQAMERQLLQQEASMISQGQVPQFKNGMPRDEAGDMFIKVEKIGNTFGVDYINVSGYGDGCYVHFDRGILFYRNNYRVTLSIAPIDITPIAKSMPDYFGQYTNQWCWNKSKYNDPESSFENIVLNGNGSPAVQSWYHALDQILSTLTFTSPTPQSSSQVTCPSGQINYFSNCSCSWHCGYTKPQFDCQNKCANQ